MMQQGGLMLRYVCQALPNEEAAPMPSLLPDRRQVNVRQQFESALAEAHTALLTALGARLSHVLAQDLDALLGREPYERRRHVRTDVEGGECHRCHSRESRRMPPLPQPGKP